MVTGTETLTRPDAKLSRLQKSILLWLLRQTEELEVIASDDRGLDSLPVAVLANDEQRRVIGARIALHWGVWWRIGDSTPAERAAFSRALKRLEERGLVLRQNRVAGAPGSGGLRDSAAQLHIRTTNVQLTDMGREVAKRLTEYKDYFYSTDRQRARSPCIPNVT
jgi:hypothetical protein